LLAAALAALLPAAAARAESIAWGYDWSRTPTVIPGDNDNTGSINLAVGQPGTAVNSSTIVAVDLTTSSTALASNPDVFHHDAYHLTLMLTDLASHMTGVFTFSGKISGTLTANSANITNVFNSPMTEKMVLGGNTYTVTIGPFSAPGPPGSVAKGSISALVEVAPGGVGVPPPSTTPEPAGAVLALLGAAAAAVARWRSRAWPAPPAAA
jgi:hypothetical protein